MVWNVSTYALYNCEHFTKLNFNYLIHVMMTIRGQVQFTTPIGGFIFEGLSRSLSKIGNQY